MKRLFEMMGGLLAKKNHTYYMEQAAKALANDDPAEAEKHYNHALELAQEAKAHDDIAEISKQLGIICERMDRLAVAETHYKRAYQTHEDSEQHQASAECLLMMGKLYYKQRRLPDAEQVLQYAMSVYQSQFGNHAEGIGRSASILADCYLDKNAYAEAEKLLRKALEIAEARNEGEQANAAVTRYKLAMALSGQKKDAEAEQEFKRACDALAKCESQFNGKTAHQACACYHHFGKFYLERNKQAAAKPYLQKAMQWAEAYPGYLDEADLAQIAAS